MENSKQKSTVWIPIGKGRNININSAFTFMILQIDSLEENWIVNTEEITTMINTYRSIVF